jgi:cytidylate kinase
VSERTKPNVSILISGPSRTGKTSAANILAERYDIETVKIGEEFRRKYGIHTSHHVERDPAFDRKMDDLQAERIRNATADDPFILEARLAAFLASQERQTRDLPIVTILLWAPEEERMERQLRKVRRDDPNSNVTLQELLDGERKREAYDLAQWRHVHPEIDHRNVFDPHLTDSSGRPVYDLVVDTRVGMPDAVADVIHDWLVQRGAFGGHDD